MKLDPFKLLKRKNALVLGDLMMDVYTKGEVERISPEAPVLILHAKEESFRAGGSGNAILNMVSMGMNVKAAGRVGEDLAGEMLISQMKSEKIDTTGIVIEKGFTTPRKNRLISSGQQLLRIDYEEVVMLSSALEKKIKNYVEKVIDEVDVVALSDYGKGFLTPSLLSFVISLSRKKKKPVIVDPKSKEFKRYSGATLIKPNLNEAYAAAGLDKKASLEDVAKEIFAKVDLDILMITRSKDGISLFSKDGRRDDIKAHAKEVVDVTGAGDTVFAVIAHALACKVDVLKGALLANVAAAIAIERFGCARVSKEEIAKRVKAEFEPLSV